MNQMNQNNQETQELQSKPEKLSLLPSEEFFFTNNDIGVTNIGDPFVLKTENGYYMYCTSAPNGFYCWKSDDLVHWTDKKMCYTRKTDSWCVDRFWAPEVLYYNEKYYMFYTARNQSQSLRIGLAVSEQPDGPFEDYANAPLFDPGYAVIDSNPFIDEDGKAYLYYSRDCSENIQGDLRKSEIYGIELSSDLTSVVGDPVLLLTPDQNWEKLSLNPHWNEGPEMIKYDGKYYLTYSANYFASPAYSLGYAISETPLGNFVKAEENPILSSGARKDISGTGHHSFTVSPDNSQLWVVYHSHTNPLAPSGDRRVNIDRMEFTQDGKLFMCGPATALQPMPSGTSITDVTALFTSDAGELLTDGMYSTYKKHKDKEVTLTSDPDNNLTVSLQSDNPHRVSAVAVYPGIDSLENIQSIYLRFGDGTETEALTVTDETSAPLLLAFDEQDTNEIILILTLRESVTSVELSEISILQEKP